jgi:hypothetical protein
VDAAERPLETTVCIAIIETIYVESPQPREAWVFAVPGSLDIGDVKHLYVPEGGPEPPNALTKQYVDFEWGPSAESASFLVQMAGDIAPGLFIAGLTAIANKLRKEISDSWSGQSPVLDRDQAESMATDALLLAYDTASRDSLRVIGEAPPTQNPLKYSFGYGDGRFRYEASVEQTSAGITFSRVSRRNPSSDDYMLRRAASRPPRLGR